MLSEIVQQMESIPESWIPMDTLEYRGETIKFFTDSSQVFSCYHGKYIEFGQMNTNYKEDMKLIVDEYLDTISRFKEDPRISGAKLTWFQNGAFRDAKLVYRQRILKIYFENTFNENDMISDAYQILCYKILNIKPKPDVFKIV